MAINFRLICLLAARSLRHHALVTIATVLGVAVGVSAVTSILIVDANTAHTRAERSTLDTGLVTGADVTVTPPITVIHILRAGRGDAADGVGDGPPRLPTQKGAAPSSITDPQAGIPGGEEDYQAMRLAVRLASAFAFLVGAVIIFYTMRHSVTSRAREFSLLLCLGERRRTVALSLLAEALTLGVIGTALGAACALPLADALLDAGISTNGRRPLGGFRVPWGEIVAVALIGVVVASAGVIAPTRQLRRLRVAEVLQPRFVTTDGISARGVGDGLGWLIPAVVAVTYVAVRPLLHSWLSVVAFFAIEAAFVVVFAGLALWFVRPLLRGLIIATEALVRPFLPLETLLTGRRLRLTSERIVFAVAGVTLVFSLIHGLHGVTRGLKDEIRLWAQDALLPYGFFERVLPWPVDEPVFQGTLARDGLAAFRMSEKAGGALPLRLVRSADINPYLQALDRRPLVPGTVVFSRTLAARHGVRPGDALMILADGVMHRFEVIDVADDIGFFAENGPYVDLKSYALFSDGNPLFADNLERTLGRYAVVRAIDRARPPNQVEQRALGKFYTHSRQGYRQGAWQLREIDRDFLIFDVVLLMTVVLAVLGVANTMVIQVHARRRELAVLRTVGLSRRQVGRMLVLEGVLIGTAGALLAAGLGTALSAISVSFLDAYTLFEYVYRFSIPSAAVISVLAVVTCVLAALYPTVVAGRVSSAESLHYE